jgi:hypothetical protein
MQSLSWGNMSELTRTPFAQKVLKTGSVQVISAADELFNHVDSNLPMWAETGDRSVRLTVTFDKPFGETPALTLGVIGLDCDHSTNLRYGLSAEKVFREGFEVVFVTWGDTRIARASVSWQAIGSPVSEPPPVSRASAASTKK